MRGRTLKDEAEGWITIKGNAGTKYAEASTKHYSILQEVPLQKMMGGAGVAQTPIRTLAKGEAIQVLEGPKEVPNAPEVRIKSKALSDGAAGWVTLTAANMMPWTPFYKCLLATPLKAAEAADAAAVRDLAVGEVVELLEGPTPGEGKVLGMKCRADRDGAVGWCTIRDSEGKAHLKC